MLRLKRGIESVIRLLISGAMDKFRSIASAMTSWPVHGSRFRRYKRFDPVKRRTSPARNRRQKPSEGSHALWTNRRAARFSR